MEGGEAALAFASGMGAISSVILAYCQAGDNFVSTNTLYGGTHNLFKETFPRFNIEAREVDTTNLENVINAIDDKTRLLYIETPANPTLTITDLKACAKIARDYKIPLVVDNTFATPYFQRPLEMGADVVIHSATKYIGGHGDTVAGVVVGKKNLLISYGANICAIWERSLVL